MTVLRPALLAHSASVFRSEIYHYMIHTSPAFKHRITQASQIMSRTNDWRMSAPLDCDAPNQGTMSADMKYKSGDDGSQRGDDEAEGNNPPSDWFRRWTPGQNFVFLKSRTQVFGHSSLLAPKSIGSVAWESDRHAPTPAGWRATSSYRHSWKLGRIGCRLRSRRDFRLIPATENLLPIEL